MRNLRTRVDAGFTLVEVLVVLAIVSVLLAVTSPSLRSFTEGRKLVSGGDALKGTCAFARDTATTEGVGYAVVLDLENARYWVAAEAALETFDLSETLGENAYGAEQEATTEETAAQTATATSPLRNPRVTGVLGVPHDLATSVRLFRVDVDREGEVTSVGEGYEYISFRPDGTAEPASVYLVNSENRVVVVDVPQNATRIETRVLAEDELASLGLEPGATR